MTISHLRKITKDLREVLHDTHTEDAAHWRLEKALHEVTAALEEMEAYELGKIQRLNLGLDP